MDEPHLREVALNATSWSIDPGDRTKYAGRACVAYPDAFELPMVRGVTLEAGVLEVDLAVTAERSFHGVAWGIRDAEHYESFFLRPHQVGNPDAIQYTPVTNGISSWQLYHGDGFWAPIAFPIEEWFTLRVVFDVYVGDLETPALVVRELKLGAGSGGIGLLVGGPGLRVARFAYAPTPTPLVALIAPEAPAHPGVVRDWEVSDAFAEDELRGAVELPGGLVAGRSWTPVRGETGGLLDLARVNGIHDGRNTILRGERSEVRAAEIGFSDRCIVFLNGRALFRGDDTYRSRDYRFLGSIGFWDTVYLPLMAGENDLVVAVSEDFGGWGVQARLLDPLA